MPIDSSLQTPPDPSLYELLAAPAPPSVTAGETQLTATKETMDNDTEDVSDDDILEL